jgi:hypothetical protein
MRSVFEKCLVAGLATFIVGFGLSLFAGEGTADDLNVIAAARATVDKYNELIKYSEKEVNSIIDSIDSGRSAPLDTSARSIDNQVKDQYTAVQKLLASSQADIQVLALCYDQAMKNLNGGFVAKAQSQMGTCRTLQKGVDDKLNEIRGHINRAQALRVNSDDKEWLRPMKPVYAEETDRKRQYEREHNLIVNIDNKVKTLTESSKFKPPTSSGGDRTQGTGGVDMPDTAERTKELERVVGLEKTKIESTLGGAANNLTTSCGNLASIASRAVQKGNEAQGAMAELPVAGDVAAVVTAAGKCQAASGIRSQLEAMSKETQGLIDRVGAALDGLEGIADTCSSKQEASMIRGGFKGAGGTIMQINGAVGKANALKQQLANIQSQATGAKATISAAQAAKAKITDLEAKAQAEKDSFDAQKKPVGEYGDKLRVASDQMLVSVANLEGAFSDVLEAVRKAKFDELRGLTAAYSAKTCSVESYGAQVEGGMTNATNAKNATSRVAIMEAQLSNLDSCQIAVDDLVVAIEGAQGQAGNLLIVHSDLPDRAAECEQKVATASKGSGQGGDQTEGGTRKKPGPAKGQGGDQIDTANTGQGGQPGQGSVPSGADLAGRFGQREGARTQEVTGRSGTGYPPPGYGGGPGAYPGALLAPGTQLPSKPTCRSDSDCKKGYCCVKGECILDSQAHSHQ